MSSLGEFLGDVDRIDEVPVVPQCYACAVRTRHERRLRVLDHPGRPGSRITDVTDREVPGQSVQNLLVEYLVDQT